MNTLAYLDDQQIERLADLLDQRAVPFKGFNLEALDGFLSALTVAPDLVLPSEWQAQVWGGKTPRWDSDDEAMEVQTLLLGHWNMVSARVRHDSDTLPEHLAPLLWLPEDEEPENPDELDVGADWALGFFRGAELRESAWDAWLDEHEWVEDIFERLHRLAAGEAPDDESGEDGRPVTYRERLEIVMALPDMLADLNVLRVEALTPREPIRRAPAPERNAPCPCGSGAKYKKCCGAA